MDGLKGRGGGKMADKMAARNGNGIISPEMIQAIIYYQSKILKKKKESFPEDAEAQFGGFSPPRFNF